MRWFWGKTPPEERVRSIVEKRGKGKYSAGDEQALKDDYEARQTGRVETPARGFFRKLFGGD